MCVLRRTGPYSKVLPEFDMNRRSFLKTLGAAGAFLPGCAEAALPKAKITRVRIYQPPNLNVMINQSNMVVTVETDIGITGVGEGGTQDCWSSARCR